MFGFTSGHTGSEVSPAQLVTAATSEAVGPGFDPASVALLVTVVTSLREGPGSIQPPLLNRLQW